MLLTGLSGHTALAESVKVRGGEHDGFARLVFDWQSAVSYKATIEQQRLVLSFGRAASFDVGILQHDLEDYIDPRSVRQEAGRISLGLKQPLTLKHFTLGPKVVIDLMDGGSPPIETAAVSPAKPSTKERLPAVRLRVGHHPDFDRLVFEWPDDVSYRILGAAPNPTIAFSAPGRLDTKRFRARSHKRIASLETGGEASELTVGLQVPRSATLRHYRDGGQVVVDVVDAVSPVKSADPTSSAQKASQARSPADAEMPSVPKTEKVMTTEATRTQRADRAKPTITDSAASQGSVGPSDDQAARAEKVIVSDPATPTGDTVEESVRTRVANGASAVAERLLDGLVPLITMAGPAGDASGLPGSDPGMPAAEPPMASPEKAGTVPAKEGPASAKASGEGTEPKAQEAMPPKDMVLDMNAPLELLPEDLAGLWREQLAEPPTAPAGTTVGPMPQLDLPDELSELTQEGLPASRLVVAPEVPDAAKSAASLTADAVDPQGPEYDWVPIPGRNLRPEPAVALAFNWSDKTALAAFRRGSYLWFVFDRQSDEAIADRIAEVVPGLGPVERMDIPGATVVRMEAPLSVMPHMIKEQASWVVDLRARANRPELPIKHEISGAGRDREISFRVAKPGRVIEIVDPEYGDRLLVVPVGQAGVGLGSPLQLPEVESLTTLQGLVLRPLAEDLEVRVAKKNVRVSTPRGLLASDAIGEDIERQQSTPILGQRLFDLAAWRIAPDALSSNHKQVLLQAVERSSGADLSRARLKMARFYFGHGLGLESRAAIELVEKSGSRYSEDPEFLLMKAATLFLVEDYEAARALLANPVLAQEWEALPWHAAIAAIAQEWDFAANAFQLSDPLIEDYARPIRDRLRLLAAEARIGIGDSEGAEFYLERIRQEPLGQSVQAQVDFLEGKRRLLEFRISTARELFERVATGPHPTSRARARLALIDLEAADEASDKTEIAAELDRLRFAWRGNAFEFALEARLAELFYLDGKYRKTLATLNRIVLKSPDEIIAKQADRRMREVFKDLYLGDPKDGLPPLTALALYEEYRDLSPDGEEGRQTVGALIDRLIDVDLLNQAAALLEDEIQFELADEAKAIAGEKLAAIRLQANLPSRALDALNASEIIDTSEALLLKRHLLRARALAALDRTDEALSLLAENPGVPSLRLQCEILWARQDWPAAAATLEALVASVSPTAADLSDQDADDLTRLAVALTMSNNTASLVDLDHRFGAAMREHSKGGPFALLTGDIDRQEIKTIADELAGAERLQSYLSNLRNSL